MYCIYFQQSVFLLLCVFHAYLRTFVQPLSGMSSSLFVSNNKCLLKGIEQTERRGKKKSFMLACGRGNPRRDGERHQTALSVLLQSKKTLVQLKAAWT